MPPISRNQKKREPFNLTAGFSDLLTARLLEGQQVTSPPRPDIRSSLRIRGEYLERGRELTGNPSASVAQPGSATDRGLEFSLFEAHLSRPERREGRLLVSQLYSYTPKTFAGEAIGSKLNWRKWRSGSSSITLQDDFGELGTGM
jgi:hypothetical protein